MVIRLALAILWMVKLVLGSPSIGDICPYTSFCTEGTRSNDTQRKQSTCCFPCSCSDKCHLMGNCCHDKLLGTSATRQPPYPCLRQDHIYTTYLKLNLSNKRVTLPFARVVNGCPDDVHNVTSDTLKQCYSADGLDDLVFVTSISSGVTYLNKHCAACHGETNVTSWDLYIIQFDPDIFLSSEVSEQIRDDYLLQTDGLISVPPSDYVAKLAMCERFIRRTCNNSINWDVYDKTLQNNCLGDRYNNLYYDKTENIFYKNPFCYMCYNTHATVLDHESCSSYKDFTLGSKGIGDTSFSALIKPSKPKSTDNIETMRKVCGIGETFDVFLTRCTNLLCPPGTQAFDDECRPLLEKDSGVVMLVAFMVNFSQPTNQYNHNEFLKELVNLILMEYNINENGLYCKFCEPMLFIKFNNMTYFKLSIVSSENCSYLLYIEKVSLVYKDIQFFSNVAQMNVTLKIDNHFTTTGVKLVVSNELQRTTECIEHITFTEKMVPCPSILVNVSDIKSLSLDEKLQRKMFRLATQMANGDYRLCLDQYEYIYQLASSVKRVCLNKILMFLNILWLTGI